MNRNLHKDCNFILLNLLESVNFHMIEMTKEKNLELGLLQTLERAIKSQNSILFSYSFRFEVRDLLPILTHQTDKNTIRVYWEQPSQGFSFAGLGSILEFQQSKNNNSPRINQKIREVMKQGICITDNSLIGPRIIGGFAFNEYERSPIILLVIFLLTSSTGTELIFIPKILSKYAICFI